MAPLRIVFNIFNKSQSTYHITTEERGGRIKTFPTFKVDLNTHQPLEIMLRLTRPYLKFSAYPSYFISFSQQAQSWNIWIPNISNAKQILVTLA